MDRDSNRTSFSMKDLKPLNIRDKDNVQMQPKPPMHIQHPRLAPTGSSGIKLDRMPPPQQARQQEKPQRPSLDRELGKPSNVHKEFKPLAAKTPDKGLSKGR